MPQKSAIIIGAGPAGLTAAYELLRRTDIQPIVLESSNVIGGLSCTLGFKGNRIDIGGHRFFSKSQRVMDFWSGLFPIQTKPSRDEILLGGSFLDRYKATSNAADPETINEVFLRRNRISRIFYDGKFFDYPVRLNFKTLSRLGPGRVAGIASSYSLARIRPIRPERSLEDFLINRFGRILYETFFKDYTEKVWGTSCRNISPEWGAQRIKGLSISKALLHAFLKKPSLSYESSRTNVETSLIGEFLYPKLGPGQLWEHLAGKIVSMGGKILLEHRVTGCVIKDKHISSIQVVSPEGNKELPVERLFSTMPIKDLVGGMEGEGFPEESRTIASGLIYRDFMTVGLLVNRLKIKNEAGIRTLYDRTPDNWLYMQDGSVKMGRIQIFNNWSPYLAADNSKTWLGLEYFCNEGDALWRMDESSFVRFAVGEMQRIGFINPSDVLEGTRIRVQKAYPAYFGSYECFDILREALDSISNLTLIGRNGMHRYNNSDHSVLSAMMAVDNIVEGQSSNANIWKVNTENDLQE